MGRQQYLERLALGRSPFQDSAVRPEKPDDNNTDEPTKPTLHTDDSHSNNQTYDSKGRPINQRTEERNAAMRNAQNAVLALVGVVESKDASEKIDEARNRVMRKQWERLLEAEQERGSDLNMFLEYLYHLIRWWPDALVARIQAGLHSPSQPFADIVLRDLRRIRLLGASACFAVLLPGVVPHSLCTLSDALICGALVEGIGQLQTYLGRSTKRRQTSRWLNATALVATELLCVGVGMCLMPLEYHAETQRLGLAPNWPLLPHWRTFLPNHPSSSHNFLWTSPIELSRLRFCGSPGFWLLLQRSLTRYQDEQSPVAAQLTAWEHPTVDKVPDYDDPPSSYHDPLSWLFYQGYVLRYKWLGWLGWDLQQQDSYPENVLQNNTRGVIVSVVFGEGDSTHEEQPYNSTLGKYRSTALSMQLAKYLGERIDHFFQKLLVLPLESTVVRVVTQSFLATTLAKTPLAVAAAHAAYFPFGGGPFGNLIRHSLDHSTMRTVGGYVSKIGLGLALYCSTEILISCLIYRTYRRQGIRNFDWRTVENDTTSVERVPSGLRED